MNFERRYRIGRGETRLMRNPYDPPPPPPRHAIEWCCPGGVQFFTLGSALAAFTTVIAHLAVGARTNERYKGEVFIECRVPCHHKRLKRDPSLCHSRRCDGFVWVIIDSLVV